MKVALLASRRMVMGFLLAGVHIGYICEDAEDCAVYLKACLMDRDIGMILVSRNVASMIPDMIREIKSSSDIVPVISVIPDITTPGPSSSG